MYQDSQNPSTQNSSMQNSAQAQAPNQSTDFSEDSRKNKHKGKTIAVNKVAFISMAVAIAILLFVAIVLGVILIDQFNQNARLQESLASRTGAYSSYGDSTSNNHSDEPPASTSDIATTELDLSANNSGEKVNYSVTAGDMELSHWRLFYQDGDTAYIIYEGYLPNYTGIADNAGLTQDKYSNASYGVYSELGRNDFLNRLNGTRRQDLWDSLLTDELKNAGATAKGSVDLETWVKSWNSKGYQPLTLSTIDFSDGTTGYYVNNLDMISLSSDKGYSDALFFPDINANMEIKEDPYYGYWIASPSGMGLGYLMIATDDGKLGDNMHGFHDSKGVGLRPIITVPTSILEKSGNEWNLKI